MSEDGSQRAARRPHRPRQDASRWIFGLVITAVVASAATSAVFLAVRPQPPTPDPFAARLDSAQAEMQSLAPALEQFVGQQLVDDDASSIAIDIHYATGMPEQATSVPMVSVEGQTLTVGTRTPWRLDAVSTRHRRQFSRILDIRRSSSIARPGYIGLVELKVTRLTGAVSVSGHLPFEPPSGFQEVTLAEYTEMEESKKYCAAGVGRRARHRVGLVPLRPVEPGPAPARGTSPMRERAISRSDCAMHYSGAGRNDSRADRDVLLPAPRREVDRAAVDLPRDGAKQRDCCVD